MNPINFELLIIQSRALYESTEYAYRSYRLESTLDPVLLDRLSAAVDASLAATNALYDLRRV